jgi:TolB protein
MFSRITAALLFVGAVLPAEAERQAVLPQILVPHSYYYREMYLPQVTSGPSGVCWSPDGRDVVFSMQGSLWRQRVGTPLAEQLTNGPGYDYQPDWSPDGRFIVFASYLGDAVEIRLLEVATGRVGPLTSSGAVNVEPRFAPDGSKLAFVSTLEGGRFHIFVAHFRDGEISEVERITEDHESGLPRYYYSPFDHYLSPTWSPDGEEILFVSNRGHIWGSGGFWRMKARRGAPPREIRYEETTWRARPDWSPDGRRVVYASYLGRGWHQIWIMTDEGGDPFPLTYGDFDATSPRWSRDGRRLAYISNEGGNTSLWVQEIPGGKRELVRVEKKRFLGPVARLVVTILDASTLQKTPARVSVTGADGRGWGPDEAWRHADDAFDRAERPFEYSYSHTPGESSMTLPAGTFTVEVTKGLEYRPEKRTVTLAPGGTQAVLVKLGRLDNLPLLGWWSGDLHVHMNYGGTYRNDPRHLAFQAQAEDLHVVESLIVNKEQRVPDIAFFDRGRPDPASTRNTLIVHGQEYHTSYWGHTGLLGLKDHILLPGYAAYVNTAAASLDPMNATIFRLAHAQGALTGYVHPFDEYPQPEKADAPLTHELPVDVALGLVDYYEVLGFSDHLSSAKVWYQLLNCGFRIPAGAGTDAMANFASLRGPVGMNRVFVGAGPLLEHGAWLGALKAGRTFVTNGPLLRFLLGGKEPGGEIRLPLAQDLDLALDLNSIVPVDHLEVVRNGSVVASFPLEGGGTHASVRSKVRVESSGWYTLRAYGDHSRHPVLDIYPFATTSPIYVTVGPREVRSAEDARYFVRWIDRLLEAAGAHTAWNNALERSQVLKTLEEARAVFVSRSVSEGP